MRASWTDLRNSLMHSVGTLNANRQFKALAASSELLKNYSIPDELIQYLVGGGRELDSKDRIYSELAVIAQSGNPEARLATTIMCLGLWPGLEHVCAKLVRTGVLSGDHAAMEVTSVFVLVATRVDLGCSRMAATLVLNTERDVRKATRARLTEELDDEEYPTQGLAAVDSAEDDSVLDDPEALKAWITRSAGRDSELVELVLLEGLDRRQAADHLGFSYEATRKRAHRAMASIRSQARDLVARHGQVADALRVIEELGRQEVQRGTGNVKPASPNNREGTREATPSREIDSPNVDSCPIGQSAPAFGLYHVPAAVCDDPSSGCTHSGEARSIEDDVATGCARERSRSESDTEGVAFCPICDFQAAFDGCQMNITSSSEPEHQGARPKEAHSGPIEAQGERACKNGSVPEIEIDRDISCRDYPAKAAFSQCEDPSVAASSSPDLNPQPGMEPKSPVASNETRWFGLAFGAMPRIDTRAVVLCPIEPSWAAFTQREEVRPHAKKRNADTPTFVVANGQSIGADSTVGAGNHGGCQKSSHCHEKVVPFGVAKLRLPSEGMSAGASGPRGPPSIRTCSLTAGKVNVSAVLKGGGCEFKGDRAKRL